MMIVGLRLKFEIQTIVFLFFHFFGIPSQTEGGRELDCSRILYFESEQSEKVVKVTMKRRQRGGVAIICRGLSEYPMRVI